MTTIESTPFDPLLHPETLGGDEEQNQKKDLKDLLSRNIVDLTDKSNVLTYKSETLDVVGLIAALATIIFIFTAGAPVNVAFTASFLSLAFISIGICLESIRRKAIVDEKIEKITPDINLLEELNKKHQFIKTDKDSNELYDLVSKYLEEKDAQKKSKTLDSINAKIEF